MSRVLLIVALLICTTLVACANSEPEVSQVFDQVNRNWDPLTGRWSQKLSVFVQVSNSDGLEALSHLSIINDSAHWHWTLTPSTWTRVDRPGETWLGSAGLSVADEALPTGSWRIQVVTVAGQVTELVFALPPEAPGTPAARTGEVRLKVPAQRSGEYVLSGFAPDYLAWAYGDDGELLGQKKLVEPTLTLSSIAPGPEVADHVRTLVFYSFDAARGEGLMAGPFALK